MRTLGIDLSTTNAKTGAVVLDWARRQPRVVHAQVGSGRKWDDEIDDFLIDLAHDQEVDAVAIDVPFGWPVRWRDEIRDHRPGDTVAPELDTRLLTWRATDAWVAEYAGITPQRVAASWLGATAIRGARLVHALVRAGFQVDVGADRRPVGKFVCETYPAAVCKPGFDPSEHCDLGQFEVALATDHVRDALVCAYVAKLTADGKTFDVESAKRTEPKTSIDLTTVPQEGWIRLPTPDSYA